MILIISKLICGTLVPGLILMCSTGTMVMLKDLEEALRELAMKVVMSVMVSTGVLLMARMMLLRRVEY